jgi:formiminoglutamase
MYRPPEPTIWNGRNDATEGSSGFRWHQIVRCIDLEKQALPLLDDHGRGIVLMGFSCDEGVRRNRGRTGAKEGPECLRKACCNHANHFSGNLRLFDVGDICCADRNLESAQNELKNAIYDIYKTGYFPFVMGGGHEVALPHYEALRKSVKPSERLGIFNIDAHFDLRQPANQGTSGTPFFEISELCISHDYSFDYFVAGIQKSANTRALFERANELGVSYVLADDIHGRKGGVKINDFVQAVDAIYLTICMDVFDHSIAPGVSAPCAGGLHLPEVTGIVNQMIESGKLISANIAELNPSFDTDSNTARLAAQLMFRILTGIAG